jgi:hypothetical protein
MTVRVDPAQLDGYAAQLERNAGYFVAPLREYCAANCRHTEAMTGLLVAVKPLVELAGDSTTGLFTSGERNLFQVAANLRLAAADYRARDEAAAERVWQTLPRRHAPQGYTEHHDNRHPGDYADPFVPRLVPPVRHDDVRHTVEEARRTLGVLEEWSRRYVHFSIAEAMAHYLTGDWDTVRENAAGYAALAGPDGVSTIRENLRHGMDSLSSSWESPAATEFDFTIRGRWMPAIDAVRHVLVLHKETFELLARSAQQTYEACLLALEAFKHWVVEKCLRIIKLVAAVLRMEEVWREVIELAEHMVRFWHEMKMLFELLERAIGSATEAVRAAAAEVAVADDLWASGGNRLDPVTVGQVGRDGDASPPCGPPVTLRHRLGRR